MKKLILLLALLGVVSASCGEKKVVKKDTVVKKDLPKISEEEQLKIDAPENEKKGLEFYEAKNYASAKKFLTLAVKGDAKLFEALYKLGQIHLIEGEKEQAEDYFRKAMNINEAHKMLNLQYGNLLIELKRWPDAKEFFEIQFARDKTFAEAAVSLLAIYKHLVEKEKDEVKVKQLVKKSESFAQKALKEIPGDAAIYNNLGQIYYLADQKSLAFYVLSIAEKNDEKSAIVLNTLGTFYEKEGNVFRAKIYYKKALKNNPAYIPALKNMVRFELESLNYTDAKKYFSQILKAEPQNLNALYGLSICDLGLFKYAEAIKKFDTLYQQSKEDKYALIIAEIYYKNLYQDPKYMENIAKKKEFLTKAKQWYKLYVDNHKELRKDNDIVMIYTSIDSEINMLKNPDSLKVPEESEKKVELTEEQKKKKEEILKQRKAEELKAKKEECLKEGNTEEDCNLIAKKTELQEKYDSCVEEKTEEECVPLLKEYQKLLEGKSEEAPKDATNSKETPTSPKGENI